MTVTCGRFGNSATTARPLPTRSPSQLRRYFLFLENEKKFAYGSLRVAYSGVIGRVVSVPCVSPSATVNPANPSRRSFATPIVRAPKGHGLSGERENALKKISSSSATTNGSLWSGTIPVEQ